MLLHLSLLKYALFISLAAAATATQSVYTAEVTAYMKYFPKAEHEWTTGFHTEIKSCPYKHINDIIDEPIQSASKQIIDNNPKSETKYPIPFPPKVVSLKAKVSPTEIEKLILDYMREVLHVYGLKVMEVFEPEKWKQELGKISRKILDCEVSDQNYRTTAGLTLGEFSDEVQKAIEFLQTEYRTIKEGFANKDRSIARKYFENQLKPILHNLEMAMKFHNHAEVMEQKWRSYFLVDMARQRFSPLTLEDDEVFEPFYQIYNTILEKPQPEKPLPSELSTMEEKPQPKVSPENQSSMKAEEAELLNEVLQFLIFMELNKQAIVSKRGYSTRTIDENEV